MRGRYYQRDSEGTFGSGYQGSLCAKSFKGQLAYTAMYPDFPNGIVQHKVENKGGPSSSTGRAIETEWIESSAQASCPFPEVEYRV